MNRTDGEHGCGELGDLWVSALWKVDAFAVAARATRGRRAGDRFEETNEVWGCTRGEVPPLRGDPELDRSDRARR